MKSKIRLSIYFLLTIIVLTPVLEARFGSAQTQTTFSVRVAFPQLSFSQPVGLYSPNDGSNRLFVVEQAGKIEVFQNSATQSTTSVFLDLTDKVLFGGEQGLLGLAFHPNFASNGYFFVDYVAPNPTRTVISRFAINPSNPDQANKGSELIVLEISQPFSNHKGGQIAFGPDGYLYIGMGDGGGAGDPYGNGQSLSTLLGKILRVDVNNPASGKNYGIPADNPFVNTVGFRPEIFAYGFRNPWRFSFDEATGNLWVGDVGQNRIEEIDVVQKGKNYGWNMMEGSLCYNPPSGCNDTGLEKPVYEYDHALGFAVVGGFVYHGQAISALTGKYVYADYGSGRIWALTLNASGVTENMLLVSSGLSISSFGLNRSGGLYLCSFDGKIYELDAVTIPEIPSQGVLVILLILLAGAIVLVKLRESLSFPERCNHLSCLNARRLMVLGLRPV